MQAHCRSMEAAESCVNVYDVRKKLAFFRVCKHIITRVMNLFVFITLLESRHDAFRLVTKTDRQTDRHRHTATYPTSQLVFVVVVHVKQITTARFATSPL